MELFESELLNYLTYVTRKPMYGFWLLFISLEKVCVCVCVFDCPEIYFAKVTNCRNNCYKHLNNERHSNLLIF
jgi:hypothetical protein